VPQSDGKIGVYACICVVFFTIAFVRTRRKTLLIGVVLACTTLVFTQSRSSALGMMMTMGCLYLYYLVTTRSVAFKAVAAVLGSIALIFMLVNFEQIYSTVKGEGVFEENVNARSMGTDHGLAVIADYPLFGAGGESLEVAGIKNLEVHNTFLGLSIKSGMPNGFLTAALLSGPLVEHNLYPGYLNEHLWLIAPVAIAVRYFEHQYQPSPARLNEPKGRAGFRAMSRPRIPLIRKALNA